jgi:phosphoglycolate phosphatase
MSIRLVLFDLDGTLADTAPDLAATVNRMLAVRGQAPVPLAQLRPLASHGARGLIGQAFGVTPADAGFESLRQEFFKEYESALCRETTLFPQMEEALRALDSGGVRWGIVTNKIARFTDPLVRALQLEQRVACVVSGDTTPHTKPHPAPLLHAVAAAGISAAETVYVGDDLRDIQAGKAAEMRTIAAAYGYLGDGIPVDQWGADHIIYRPDEIVGIVMS